MALDIIGREFGEKGSVPDRVKSTRYVCCPMVHILFIHKTCDIKMSFLAHQNKVQNIRVSIDDSEHCVATFHSRHLITRKKLLDYVYLVGVKLDILQDSSQTPPGYAYNA